MSHLAWMDLSRQFMNKGKKMMWAKENIGKEFEDVVWTDECSIQLSTHRQFAAQRKAKGQTTNRGILMALLSPDRLCTGTIKAILHIIFNMLKTTNIHVHLQRYYTVHTCTL